MWFSCKVSVILVGCAEIPSLAIWDLLLLFRVHALWGKRRDIVVATSILYCITYVGHSVAGLIGAVEIIPHLYFDPVANACATDYRPTQFAIAWAFVLFCETVMFTLTIIKVIQDRKSDHFNNPLMKSLYYGQIIYNVVIIAVRVFNLVICLTTPPSYLFLGLYFLWAMVTVVITRMMLHLRRAASSDSQHGQTTSFGETAFSTLVWARYTLPVNSSRTAFSPNIHSADARRNIDWSGEDGESGERIELRSYRAEGIPSNENG
ncbi:hypothetical protein M407DRAFT_24581 [Tulasnella calospora MUT 4182]|uniref:Uncharacterized protein n=1 Tax=Tulasnella calospora MUT 4182 TaxID=1051891 RepID=A0A0C3Q8J5_9AGAM|nr:hypothetical protein M407DRAFT_24581 [Tulasnella calospora MUT 4182]